MSRPTLVYRCLAHSGALLYVGCTHNLSARFVDHRNSAWWDYCRDIAVEEFPDRATALAAEAAAIRTELPAFNLMGTGTGLSTLRQAPRVRQHLSDYQPRHAA